MHSDVKRRNEKMSGDASVFMLSGVEASYFKQLCHTSTPLSVKIFDLPHSLFA